MKSFFKSSKEYKRNPTAFLGTPQLPGYKKKGGQCTAILSNQDCKHVEQDKKFKLPLTDIRLDAGKINPDLKLKQVEVCPTHGVFVLHLVFEEDEKPLPEKTMRAAALDPGLNNFASIVTSSGSKGLIVKGQAVQNTRRNEQYRAARFQSGQCGRSKKKFIPSRRYNKWIQHYENQTKDLVSKTAVRIMKSLKKNEIDTLIVGHNKGQKPDINIGTKNNQNFCTMPTNLLRQQLEYRCKKEGILYLETEESYTSKASFLDEDGLPVYGEESEHEFSPRRTTRGQYKSKNGMGINADLNGAANIGRKLFPELFTPEMVNFEADVWRIQSSFASKQAIQNKMSD
ncbi:transposase [Erysipelotrichaceae bacterium RD49]|nr:transposase [Erysipelotrichaceae bacterium RD49]